MNKKSIELFGEKIAKQLEKEDKEVDKMKISELNSDLSLSQQQIAKKMRTGDRKTFNMDTSTKERKVDADKAEIISVLISAIESIGGKIGEQKNEREFTFVDTKEKKYKVTLSAPRK